MFNERGFLLLEVLIAGLILTSSIAASMYLFKMGYEYLQKANESNIVSTKLTDAMNILKTTDLTKESGSEYLGADVTLHWKAQLLEKVRPTTKSIEGDFQSPNEHYLYKVDFTLQFKDMKRDYSMNIFRFKRVVSELDFF
ncbi:MAG: hypothetical protein N2738_02900 [Thermodesulfovibrionales bacterium]|nr:hypothetical protein [Thermodesulfovibrionales bacterium]